MKIKTYRLYEQFNGKWSIVLYEQKCSNDKRPVRINFLNDLEKDDAQRQAQLLQRAADIECLDK